MERGYIKLWRCIDDHEIFSRDNTCFIIFVKLCLLADWKSGSVTTGLNKLSAACNMSRSTVYSALGRLRKSNVIQTNVKHTSTTIYICNWRKYQHDVKQDSNEAQENFDTIQEVRKRKRNNSINTKVSKKASDKKEERNILGILNEITGRNFRVEPRGIEKTKSLFTNEEIRKALTNLSKDEWHREKLGELKPDYLLRYSTIDNFLNIKIEDKNSSGLPKNLDLTKVEVKYE